MDIAKLTLGAGKAKQIVRNQTGLEAGIKITEQLGKNELAQATSQAEKEIAELKAQLAKRKMFDVDKSFTKELNLDKFIDLTPKSEKKFITPTQILEKVDSLYRKSEKNFINPLKDSKILEKLDSSTPKSEENLKNLKNFINPLKNSNL